VRGIATLRARCAAAGPRSVARLCILSWRIRRSSGPARSVAWHMPEFHGHQGLRMAGNWRERAGPALGAKAMSVNPRVTLGGSERVEPAVQQAGDGAAVRGGPCAGRSQRRCEWSIGIADLFLLGCPATYLAKSAMNGLRYMTSPIDQIRLIVTDDIEKRHSSNVHA
jgi:hypothetical protein